MANDVSAYAGSSNAPKLAGGDGAVFLLAYNNTGASIAAGSIVIVTENKGTAGNHPSIVACATTAVAVRVGVANNVNNISTGDIPASTWGWVQIDGYCPKVKVPGSTATERLISATNATQVATDVAAANADGVTGLTAKVFGVTKAAESGGFAPVALNGKFVTI